MAKLEWDKVGERFYETGTDHAVLYVYENGKPGNGVAWNGLTSVTESPSGAEATPLYADNMKYLTLRSLETFGGTIEAYTYPPEWDQCDGSAEPVPGVKLGQQTRKTFGFSYRTRIGNDEVYDDFGYKIHLVYGASASPSEKAYQTVNDSPEAVTFSWTFETTPVPVDGFKAVAHMEIDSTKFTDEAGKAKLAALEAKLYGSEDGEAELPLPHEVLALLGYTA